MTLKLSFYPAAERENRAGKNRFSDMDSILRPWQAALQFAGRRIESTDLTMPFERQSLVFVGMNFKPQVYFLARKPAVIAPNPARRIKFRQYKSKTAAPTYNVGVQYPDAESPV